MRGREFLMKDAYSFHLTQESLQQTYDGMYQAYCNIFSRLGLEFRPVVADNGSIGGEGSHEFHVLADSGEDAIIFSDTGSYAANMEKATAQLPQGEPPAASQPAFCPVELLPVWWESDEPAIQWPILEIISERPG